jgi:glycosyltransferase involved in cell wall biosynthesis
MGPSIEIAIPFYGRRDHLEEAVLSVLGQHDPAWQLTVYDDNPVPDTESARWLSELGDPRVRYSPNGRNLGVSGSFNRCVQEAEADFVVIMGCDDRMLSDYVGSARSALSGLAQPVSAYMPGVRVIDGEGADCLPLVDRIKRRLRPSLREIAVLSGEPLARSLMHGVWTYFPAILWRREVLALHRFDDDSLVVQDIRLLVDLILEGGSLCLDPAETFEYRRHAGAASSVALSSGTRFAEESALYRDCAERFAARGWRSAERAAAWHVTSRLHSVVVVGQNIGHGRLRQAGRLLREHSLARFRTR